MTRVFFKNPNDPVQPLQGVYRWFVRSKGSVDVTIYVGNTGARQGKGCRRASTLGRGLSELQRGSISSDKGSTLDTDFIVGTCIKLLVEMGYSCHWEHLDDDPVREPDFCKAFSPTLQGQNVRISSDLKVKRNRGYWVTSPARLEEAEHQIKLQLLQRLKLQTF